jgi:TPR repeat protein
LGLAWGKYHVGVCFKDGKGVDKNNNEAVRYLRAAGNTSDAATLLAKILPLVGATPSNTSPASPSGTSSGQAAFL